MSRTYLRYLASAAWIGFGAYLVFLGFYGQVSGHNWGGDFALYIEQARNIAEGRPHDQVKYVWGALNQVSPPTYPIGLPLLLAPIVARSGLALGPMFVLMSVLLIGYFAASFWFFRHRFPAVAAAALTLVVALNPFVNAYKNAVLSDLPFSAAILVSLTLFLAACRSADRLADPAVGETRHAERRWLWLALGSGLALGIAGAFRVAAVAMVAAVVVHWVVNVVRLRSVTAPLTLIPCVVLSIALAMIAFLPRGSLPGYEVITQRWTPEMAWANLRHYGRVLGDFFPAWGYYVRTAVDPWAVSDHYHLRWVAIFVTAGLAIIGVVRKCLVHRNLEIDDLFLVSYVAMLVSLTEVGGPRYLLPVFPVYLGYVGGGLQVLLATRATGRLQPIVRVVIVAVLAYASLRLFESKDFRIATLPDGPQVPEAVEMIDAVKTLTPVDATVIFHRPTVLALYSGRRSTGGPRREDFDAIDRWYKQIGVTHVVEDLQLRSLVSQYLAWRQRGDEHIWSNKRFVLWKLADGQAVQR